MKKTTAITLSLLLGALVCGCNPSGCGGASSTGLTSTSSEVDPLTTNKGKRKMKIVQLRPEFKQNRPMEANSLKAIDSSQTSSSTSDAQPSSTGH